MTIAEEKQAQRAAGRAARKALDAPQRAAANAALCRRVLELDAYRTANTLLLYAAFGGEADLTAVAAEAVPGTSTGCSTIFAQKGIPKMEQLSARLLLTAGILLLIAEVIFAFSKYGSIPTFSGRVRLDD